MRRPIGDLDLFVAVARHRSFRGAAAETGLAASSLSDRVRALETGLGTRLLNRTTRSVGLTTAGAALLARLEPTLAELEAALDDAAGGGGTPSGLLRINAPRAAAQLVLPTLIARFLEAHPRVALELVVEDGFVDIVAAGFDAGVRYGESLAKDMIAVPIGPTQRYALVASPAFLARHGTPSTPGDLVDCPAICHRFPGGVALPWEFERGAEVVTLRPAVRLTCNDPQVELMSALDGVGVLFTFEGWVRTAVAEGGLVSLLEAWLPAFPGPFLYYASRRLVPPTLRAFIDFVRSERRG